MARRTRTHDEDGADRARHHHCAPGHPAELAAPSKSVWRDDRRAEHPFGPDFHGGNTRLWASTCQAGAPEAGKHGQVVNCLRIMIVPMRRDPCWRRPSACWLTAAGAGAQAPDTVLLEELTWTEVRDAVRAGKTTVMIPVGGTEQNGPHMALGKHNARVKVLSQQIARELGDALVAPVIAYVRKADRSAHRPYALPGTITAPEDAFEKVLESAARSFRHHGFRDVVCSAIRPRPRRGRRRWRPGSTASGRPPGYGSTRARSTTGRGRSSSRACSGRAATPRPRSAARRTHRHRADARDGPAPGPRGPPASRPRATAWTATRPAPPPSWASRARSDREPDGGRGPEIHHSPLRRRHV